MMLAITTNNGAGVDFVRISATISEVAGSLPPVTRLTSMLSFATGHVKVKRFRSCKRRLRTAVKR